MTGKKQEDAPSYQERLAAEQAVRDATGTPIKVNRNGPTHEQNAQVGSVRVVSTDKGKYTVSEDGIVEKDGKIIKGRER